MSRYARQNAVLGIEPEGARKLATARASVFGEDWAARTCALYLCGAGVGRVEVHRIWADACHAINAEVDVIARDGQEPTFSVRVGAEEIVPDGNEPIERGSRGARWALFRFLGATP